MPIVYPDAWMYRINAAFYWPYRTDQVVTTQEAIIPKGEHRYFRFNVKKEYVWDLQKQAAAAGVWVRNLACYDVPDGYFCEGFLEPKYEGVTYKKLASKLFPWAMEVSKESSNFLDEALQDFDDYLHMDYHTIHPVSIASEQDILHPGQYYPATAIYKGKRINSLSKAPPVDVIIAILRERGMDFYQPTMSVSATSVPFILKTGKEATTAKVVAELIGADIVVVNLKPLNTEDQSKLQAYDAGANIPDAVVRFFGIAGEETVKAVEGAGTLLKGVKYIALTVLIGGGIWLGLKAVPPIQEALTEARKA